MLDGGRNDGIARLLRRLQRGFELEQDLGGQHLPAERRHQVTLEYVELTLGTFEAFLDEDLLDEAMREQLREDVSGWRERLEEIYRSQARRRLRLRWHGTELAEFFLSGRSVGVLEHHEDGWYLCLLTGDSILLPPEWVAEPGLDGAAADAASSAAHERLAEYVGSAWAEADQRERR